MAKFSRNKLKRSLTELRQFSLHATNCVQMGDRKLFDIWIDAMRRQISVIEKRAEGWDDGP